MDSAVLIHYLSIAFSVGINSVGVGIGESKTSIAAIKAIDIQPSAQSAISKMAIVGTALIETSAVLGLFIAIILFRKHPAESITMATALAEAGCALSIGLTGFVVGIVTSFPSEQACLSIARQPFFNNKILNLTLLTQSIIQSPLIFSFLIALFIITQIGSITSISESVKYLSSGLCMGIGSIGPAIGLAVFSRNACKSLGINSDSYGKIFSFSIISLAIIETPVIFALLISLVLSIVSTTNNSVIPFIATALCMGVGTIFPGISSGRVSAKACLQIAYNPEVQPIVSKMSMLAQGLIDTCAIYALLISLFLMVFRF